MICPATRSSALDQLDQFIRVAALYGRDRNHVKINHPAVSRLAPAIRHRLITEQEVIQAVLKVHPLGRVEKFIQEVYWRRYWKSWLAMRPQVWTDFQQDLSTSGESEAVQRIESSESGNTVIDYFANELVSTGYLHNHARMWFAAWWIHEARLPWQSGAAFFYRHLLDGDPASNTLSWRWVAGLQTQGKTYLARRSNLEKYLAPELVDSLSAGLPAFENPHALQPKSFSKPPITCQDWPLENLAKDLRTGLWIHEEDLALETSPLGEESFAAIIVNPDVMTWDHHRFPITKRQWISTALQDAATRAEKHWQTPVSMETRQLGTDLLIQWVKSNRLDQVAVMRPEIGPLNDFLQPFQRALSQAGIPLVQIDRPEDLRIRHFATGGFFQFWERIQKTLVQSGNKDLPSAQLSLDFPT